uniref:Peptidase A2 domain-containing protein n=1 Tax=Anopheles quadriannulatus TaxID=34691 RepID=A0A182X829_ANOQN
TSSVEGQASEEKKDESEREGKEGLSGRQIAARHVLGKEVSIFSGDPEEWPLFLSTFEEAAKTCGFSSAENLIRLQRCLKGNALELVKGQLTIKENVPDVIESLKMVYGKPSLLIRSLLNKIRNLPPPRPDKMRTVIEFGLAVKALTNQMKAAKLNAHLNNPMLPLFRILPVTLYHNNNSLTIYAFVDEGSTYSLIDESIATELGVHGQKTPLTLQWTGHVTRKEPNSEVINLHISGKDRNTRYRLENVRTVGRLMLPTQTLNYEALQQRHIHLRGLPIQSYTHVQPQLLIGLDNIRVGVPIKLREGQPSEPIAAMCRLGWSIYGGRVPKGVPTA